MCLCACVCVWLQPYIMFRHLRLPWHRCSRRLSAAVGLRRISRSATARRGRLPSRGPRKRKMFVYDRKTRLFQRTEQTRRPPLSLFVWLHRRQDTQLRSEGRQDDMRDDGAATFKPGMLDGRAGRPVRRAFHSGREECPPGHVQPRPSRTVFE